MSNWADAMHTLFGMPSPEDWQAGGASVSGYCNHCQGDFTARILPSGVVLCPRCDMPGIAKVGVANLTLRRSNIVTKFVSSAKCLVLHATQTNTVCQKEMGHVGYHVDDRALAEGRKGYSWPKRDTDRQACWERHPQRAGNAPGSNCIMIRGHSLAAGHFSGPEFVRWGATAPVKEGKGRMITAKLSDTAVVGIEFHHEFVGDGKESPKILVGTSAKLYQLYETKDTDKPGVTTLTNKPVVTTLTKTLLNTAEVKCHPNDRRLGKVGGRRAALKRLLCLHEFDDKIPIARRHCAKCGVRYHLRFATSNKLNPQDRRAIWDALWDATASMRVFACGCRNKETISGKCEFKACDQHVKKDPAT